METLIKTIENLLEEFYQIRLATDKRFAGSERREQISNVDKHYAWKIEEVVRQFAINQQKETREELMSFLDELKKDNEERQNELDKLEKKKCKSSQQFRLRKVAASEDSHRTYETAVG